MTHANFSKLTFEVDCRYKDVLTGNKNIILLLSVGLKLIELQSMRGLELSPWLTLRVFLTYLFFE